jgi:hypothetical protein
MTWAELGYPRSDSKTRVVRLTWSSDLRPRRIAEVWCHPSGEALAFLYRGVDQDKPSLRLRPTVFDHDMKTLWRFLKWGRR